MSPPLDPDPAVPQRDLLLNDDVVAERVGRSFDVEVHECRRVRVKYRIGARLRLAHRLRVGASSVDVAASTFPTLERSERAYAEARERAVGARIAPPVAHDRELTTVYWAFPNDRKLRHLPALAGPDPALSAVEPAWSRSSLAAYAPEKAATVRCLDEGGRTVAYAKTSEEAERAARVHAALAEALPADDPYLRLPRPIGYARDYRTFVVEAVTGVPLQAPRAGDLRGAYRRLGRGLARLHGLAPPDEVRFRRADPDRVAAAAELIASVRGDVAIPVRRLSGVLSRLLEPDCDPVCLHGDVNFRNALLENGRVALIDLDQVASGPAAAELGSVLASLRYAGVVGLLPPALVPGLCTALLAGYAELRALPDATALRTHTSAALLAERCLRVVTRVRAEGLRRLTALVAEAGEALA
jgi:aminoglycoside phosphotransferase (APT) family kinase protein